MQLKKIARIVLYLLLLSVIVVVLLQSSIRIFVNDRLQTYIQTQVSNFTQGRYTLLVDDVKISLINHSIVINNIKLLPVKLCSDCDNARYGVTADRISLKGVGIWSYLSNKSVNADNLVFDNLSICIYQGKAGLPKKEADSMKRNFSIYPLLGPKFKSLLVKNIEISNAKIHIFKNTDSINSIFSSEENFIGVKNFALNSTVERLNRLFIADTFSVKMKTFTYHLGNGLYTMAGKNLSTSYSDSVLTIDSLELIPNYKKKEFGQVVGYQVSRVNIVSKQVRFVKMDVKLFLEHNWFISEKLYLDGFTVHVFRDKNMPFKNIVRPSVQQLIRKIPFFISVDSIMINDGDITYEDLGEGANKAGKVNFTKMNGVITGLQNDTTIYNEKSILKLDATCLLMGKGNLTAAYRFPLITDKEVFTCSGKLGTMPMSYINAFVEAGPRIAIRDGIIDSAVFNFTANEFSSAGKMKFVYHDLRIELLNKDNDGSSAKKQFFTFVAQKFVLHEQNPDRNKPLRVTDISFERNPYRFFFYYTWQSLLSGIKPALGVPKNMKIKSK